MSWAIGARRVVTVVVCTAILGTLTATAARADDPPGGGQIPAAALDLWPAHLRFLVPGTPEFTARYEGPTRQQLEGPLPDDSPAKATRTDPSCADKGGDVGLYTVDFMRHLGDVLNALQLLPGQDKLGFVTTPWPGPPADQATGGKNDGGVMPLPGGGVRYDDDDEQSAHLPDPAYIRSCAQDLAPYGRADAESPWGFDFFGEPDQGSVDALHAALAQIPARTRTVGGHEKLLSGTASWDYLNGSLSKWAYNPMDPMSYCKSGDEPNPWCMTAMFLHCPDLPATSDPAFQAVKDCRQFNANTILSNVAVANWLNMNGDKGRFHDWIGVLDIGNKWPTVRKWILTGLALAGGLYVGAASGAIAAFGLRKVLLGVAVATALTATDSWDTIWGVVTCTADVGKCLAKASASGMAQATDMVAQTATKQDLPSLQNASSVLNSLAGLSGIVMLILLLLSLCGAVLTGRMGMILPASVGVVRWGIGIGAGSTILTMMWLASTYTADAIAGAGTRSSSTISQFANGLSQDAIGAGALKIVGWILVAVLCLIGLICAVIVWIVINLSDGFIPLAVALMILQMSGATGSETARRWIHRGWGLLWTILLLRPVVTLVAKMANVNAGNGTIAGLVSGVALLAIAAVAPWLIVAMFPTIASGSVGAMRGLFAAAQGVQAMGGMVGSARRGMGAIGRATSAVGNRASQLGRLLSAGGGAGGPGAGSTQVHPAIVQSGAPKNPSGGSGGSGGGGKFGAVPAVGGPGTTVGTGQPITPTDTTPAAPGGGSDPTGQAGGSGQQAAHAPAVASTQPPTAAGPTGGEMPADGQPADTDSSAATGQDQAAAAVGAADRGASANASGVGRAEGGSPAGQTASPKQGERKGSGPGSPPGKPQDQGESPAPAGDPGKQPETPTASAMPPAAAVPSTGTAAQEPAPASTGDAPGTATAGSTGPDAGSSTSGTSGPGVGLPPPSAAQPAGGDGQQAPPPPQTGPTSQPSGVGHATDSRPQSPPPAAGGAGPNAPTQGQTTPAGWQNQPGQAGPQGWTPRPGQGYRPGRQERRPRDDRNDRRNR